MSELTPNDIADYPLRTAVRGYRVEQVDELLDRVADRIESLERQLDAANALLESAQREAAESAEVEATLKRTLVTAQRAAEETVADARAEAGRLLADATAEAEELRGSARAEAEQLRDDARADAEQQRREATEAADLARAEADRSRQEAAERLVRLGEVADHFRAGLRDHLDRHATLLDELVLPALPDVPGAGPSAAPEGPEPWSSSVGNAVGSTGVPDVPMGDDGSHA